MLLIFLICIIHFYIINVFEKALFQLTTLNTNRPLFRCKNNTSIQCQGMPSGHTETVTILSLMLFSQNIINIYIALIIIILVGLQRIIYMWHTCQQVIFGLIFGSIYTFIYLYINQYINSFLIILLVLFIPILMLLIIIIIINSKLQESIPLWVDQKLYPIIYKKRNVSFFGKIFLTSLLIITPYHSLFCSWKQLENNMDVLLLQLNKNDYDIVIGIKSGGAIVSNYISQKLDLPCYYIKIGTNCNKTVSQSISEFSSKYIFKKKNTYVICETLDIDIKGLRVLLIDESVGTGMTLKLSKQYLIEQKKAKYVSIACIEDNGFSNLPELKIAVPDKYIVWPWGFDN